MARPWTDADSDQLRQLHAKGTTRNDIARQLGRSGQTISKYATQLGLSFDRGPEVAAATAVVVTTAKARRAALAVALLEDVERLRQQLFAPTKIYNFGGRDNSYNEKAVDRPPFRDQREIATALGVLLDRAIRLDEYDSGTGVDSAVSLLGRIADGLRARHGTGDEPPAAEEAKG